MITQQEAHSHTGLVVHGCGENDGLVLHRNFIRMGYKADGSAGRGGDANGIGNKILS